MITDNGNGTYGVEFYINGKPVYVTVNNEIPTYTSGSGAFGTKFVGNIRRTFERSTQKAYVQLNEDPGYLDHTSGDEWQLIAGGVR